MTTEELVDTLLAWLFSEQPEHMAWLAQLPHQSATERRQLVRALTNLREPAPLPAGILDTEAELLSRELLARGTVEADALPPLADDERLVLWRGDITQLRVDAIVNAANPQLLGCFAPLHHCIDNAIHSAAGMGLRAECAAVMTERGRPEPTGTATSTGAGQLPSSHVLHTVGPVVRGELNREHERQLAACYTSCLRAAANVGARSVAFCCISTGEYGYPQHDAARVAVATVRDQLDSYPHLERVVFNVFTELDHELYRELLGPDA